MNTPQRLIGIGYKKQSGKDTVASYIMANYGDFKRLKFAGILKKICSELYSIDVHIFEDSEAKETIDARYGLTPRELLQQTADALKSVVPGIFIDKVINAAVLEKHPELIISDVRFPEEFNAIREAGGYLVCVNRNMTNEDDEHCSEHALDGDDVEWDFALDNNGSYEDLTRQIDIMMESLGYGEAP